MISSHPSLRFWTCFACALSVGLCNDIHRALSTSLEAEASTGKIFPIVETRRELNMTMGIKNDSSQFVVVLISSPTNSTFPSRRSHQRVDPVGKAELNKRRLIRGSKKAVTITTKEYLKEDWCKTEPFQQTVGERGCRRKRIMNQFCYGQCNSFYIPKTDRHDQDGGAFRSCAYCTPVESEWRDVVLECPLSIPRRRTKLVQIITRCKCVAVKLDGSLLSSSNNV